MEIIGPVSILFLVVVLVVWPLTVGGRYLRGRRDRAFSQKARETWMGMNSPPLGGYVPHGELPPSPRDRLGSASDDDEVG
jgi:hypothetical protein